jgi:hypothetical protein
MNANQALIAKLEENLAKISVASADEIIAQTLELETLIADAAAYLVSPPNQASAEINRIHELFTAYGRGLSHSQARVSRALGALGLEDLVYSDSEHNRRGPLPVAGVRRTSLTA